MTFSRSDYFETRNYAALYSYNFFDTFAKSVFSIFSAVFLYQAGLSIAEIFVFFAVQFGLMGLFSPLSPLLVARLGLAGALALGNACYLAGSILLIAPELGGSASICIAAFFFALQGGIIHPTITATVAAYVADKNKGKVNSLITVLRAIAAMLAAALTGALLAGDHRLLLMNLIFAALALSLLPYFFLLDRRELQASGGFAESFRFLASPDFRENLIPFSIQSFLIIERIFIPFFIFLFVGDLETMALLVAGAIVLELGATLFFGRAIDQFGRRSFLGATVLKSASSLLFLFFLNGPVWAFFSQTYAKITENIFSTSFNTQLQKKARRSDPILFATAKEMSLCFTEFFVLLALAGCAVALQEKTFLLVFASSFVAIWVLYRFWQPAQS